MNTKILFFSAPWCGPCRQMKLKLSEEVKKELSIEIIDITEQMEIATKYHVMNVPTFIKTVKDKEVARKTGALTLESLRTFKEIIND